MPTVLHVGPYRLFFYAGDQYEPEHVHIEHDDNVAKVWLDPVRLEHSGGFARPELNEILRLVQEQRVKLLEAWHDYFDD